MGLKNFTLNLTPRVLVIVFVAPFLLVVWAAVWFLRVFDRVTRRAGGEGWQ
jgi:hypothetical protein